MKRLFDYRGRSDRWQFLLAEVVRGLGLAVCYGLYRLDWLVMAAILTPVAVWPGVVGTIKRFRDLGRDPIYILPVLVYLSAGFAIGYVLAQPAIGLAALGVYLAYVLGVPGVGQHNNYRRQNDDQ